MEASIFPGSPGMKDASPEATVSVDIDVREVLGSLQGHWVNSDGLHAYVEGKRCKFVLANGSPGNHYDFCTKKGKLVINDWTMLEMRGPTVVWEQSDILLTWTRQDDTEPLQKVRRLHVDEPLTSRMAWGDAEEAEFSDAKVVAKAGRIFAVHRAVLSAASQVFHAAFSSTMREGVEAKIVIQDAPVVAVEALLHYIYSGELRCEHAATLLPLAHRYGLYDLVTQCVSHMQKTVSAKNVVSIAAALKPYIDSDDSCRDAWVRLQQSARRDPAMLDAVFRHVREPT